MAPICEAVSMTVYFEYTTSTRMPQAQLFDLARSIDAH